MGSVEFGSTNTQIPVLTLASLILAPLSFSNFRISSKGSSVKSFKKRTTSASSVFRQNCTVALKRSRFGGYRPRNIDGEGTYISVSQHIRLLKAGQAVSESLKRSYIFKAAYTLPHTVKFGAPASSRTPEAYQRSTIQHRKQTCPSSSPQMW